MQVVTPDFVKNKRVLLRSDIDVLIEGGGLEAFRLEAGLPTLRMCLEYGSRVTMMGHLGRPDGQVIRNLSVETVRRWFDSHGFSEELTSGKLEILENLRFDPREEASNENYARELAGMGDVYVNEAFSSYRPAVSTTILPTLLPHVAGLRFIEEVNRLTELRNNPKRPFVVILAGGGTGKDDEKLPAIPAFAQKADQVNVGGLLIAKIRAQQLTYPPNVSIGELRADGFDITPETTDAWGEHIMRAAEIFWNGPVGRYEDPKNGETKRIARLIAQSGAKTTIGGGDTIAAADQAGVLEKIGFVSVGGGADIKFFVDGTLPTIEALK